MVNKMTAIKDRASLAQEPTSEERGSDDLWQAVLARDRRFEADFVYGVRSTGIYCRCSCPSRRPKRQQVVFYSGHQAAEQEGFRACRRCRPDQNSPADQQLVLVRSVCRHIEESQTGTPTLAQLGRAVDTSPSHLQRVFKRLLGVTPRQYADACRQDRFKARLQSGWDITGAMYDAGYGSSSRLYEESSSNMGMSPASYRRGAKGVSIAYTTVTCTLGMLLVAATEKGVCAVKIGTSAADLEAELQREFPRAGLQHDNPGLGRWVAAILRHLAGELPNLDLPVDVRATAFQRQVWEHLRNIPYGQTRTYQQIAQQLGVPGGARAVGRACATNPVALVVPCHRVVRRDGGMGGYRWGLQRKETLLAQERTGKQAPS